ncbi:hypothetical protein C4D60_Mb08t10680 [Musa balbisiana]|uniref:Uncharacterized protein n=1 Tax=Musa balbisiana TaxID=52838 RepID=A0A4S8K2Y0_MUSBA|nr:hypothetical protein C4D60_Mb08t10680 [Musa balbisiana]
MHPRTGTSPNFYEQQQSQQWLRGNQMGGDSGAAEINRKPQFERVPYAACLVDGYLRALDYLIKLIEHVSLDSVLVKLSEVFNTPEE